MHTVLMIAQMGAVHSAKPVHHVLADPTDNFNNKGYSFTRGLISWGFVLVAVVMMLVGKVRKGFAVLGAGIAVDILFLGGAGVVALFVSILNGWTGSNIKI